MNTVINNIINTNINNSPLDQFIIVTYINVELPIFNVRIALTNITVYLIIAAFTIIILQFIATNYNKVISNWWSISLESLYSTIHSIITNQINNFKGQRFFPFILLLFIYILLNNLIGMIPHSFASTSHFGLAFSLSTCVVLGATLLGLLIMGLLFFAILVPSGCPLGLLPLLVLIEHISYLARSISLGLRLAANILSGHMLLNILSTFVYKIVSTGLLFFIIGFVPLCFIVAFSGLEVGIAFVQAQVFVVLSCSYIKDGLSLH